MPGEGTRSPGQSAGVSLAGQGTRRVGGGRTLARGGVAWLPPGWHTFAPQCRPELLQSPPAWRADPSPRLQPLCKPARRAKRAAAVGTTLARGCCV